MLISSTAVSLPYIMGMERRSDDKPEKTLIFLTKECTNLALNHLVGIEMVHCSVFMATSLLG